MDPNESHPDAHRFAAKNKRVVGFNAFTCRAAFHFLWRKLLACVLFSKHVLTRHGRANHFALLRDIDAPHEIGEPWIRAQAVESGVHFEARQDAVALLIRLLKPNEGLIFIAEGGVDH